MNDGEDKLPMDIMEDVAPPAQEPQQQEAQGDQRPRDEGGRFAPKPQDEPQPRGGPDETAAARRERAERDAARKEAAEYRAKHEALQKRFDDMAALAKGDEPADKTPDDPLKPLFEKVESIDKRLNDEAQAKQEAELWGQVRSYADQDEARFKAEKPDFGNAVQHYITSRVNEMAALGVPEDQAAAVLQQEAQQLLVQCAQSNRSPAASIYAMAQARGYQAGSSPAPQPFANPNPPQNMGGRSMGNGAGPAGQGLTAAQIAAMDDSDYFALRNTPEGKRAIQRAMMGA